TEADRIFAELTKLLKDTGIYTGTPEDIQIQDLPEDDVTTLIGEPLANSMRVRILKALAGDSKMFADIAALTGLRGGNLKFHLEKLMSSNLITQKNERDKYQITDRGRELLLAAAVLLDKIR
ncbi:MAG: winged helix-turn-helix domain-containing protein, partial [Methanocorpusculum sp.]|nr:winged helix-turn-helix domain-containing protein [Methanocorpusculum sp.]